MSGSAHRGSLAQSLQSFRATHPVRELEHRGTHWRYLRGGAGEPAVLALTGALGVAELGFEVMRALERRFTVVAPDYPALADAAGFLDGLLAILDRERIAKAVLHGGSFGGLLVQRMVERAPDRVEAIVLSHTGLVEKARIPRWALALSDALPESWFRALLARRFGPLIAPADEFWKDWVKETLDRLGKPAMMARFRLARSLALLEPGPTSNGWGGPALVVESDNDPAVRASQRGALTSRFPQARVHRFSGTGHIASVLDPEGYATIIGGFIEGRVRSSA